MSSLSENSGFLGQQKTMEWVFKVSCYFAPQDCLSLALISSTIGIVGCIAVFHFRLAEFIYL